MLETNHVQPFKKWERYLETWRPRPNGPFPSEYRVDETMRARIEMGAVGFPPISACNQMALEHRFLHDDVMYVGRILDDYDDVSQKVKATNGSCLLDSKPFDSCVREMQLAVTDSSRTSARIDKRLLVPHEGAPIKGAPYSVTHPRPIG